MAMPVPKDVMFPTKPAKHQCHFERLIVIIQRLVRGSVGLLGITLLIPAFAGDFNKSTAYFGNVYGLPESSRNVSAHKFLRAGEMVTVNGRFAVREYRAPDLHVIAVFMLPNGQLAAVTLRRPRPWAFAEFESELSTYGSRWRALARNIFLSWEGVHATQGGNALHFISPEVAGLIEEQSAPEKNEDHGS